MSQKALFIFACLMFLVQVSAAESPTTHPVTPSFELKDVDGAAARRPLQAAREHEAKGVVFIFVAIDCPISNAYAPEMKRICKAYRKSDDDKSGGNKRGEFEFYFVHADPDLTPADARKHAADYGYECPVLMDPKKELAAGLGAKVTPEAFVVSTDGVVLYHGRIDDRYVAFGKARIEPTVHDLRDALDAIGSGKPAAHPETKAIGCPI